MRKPKREGTTVVESAATPEYVVARLYLMIEALCNGRLNASPYELTWAAETIDGLDVSEETMDEATRDHQEMVGSWEGVE